MDGLPYSIDSELIPGSNEGEVCMPRAEFLARVGDNLPEPNLPSRARAFRAAPAAPAQACGALSYDSPWAWSASYDPRSGLAIIAPPKGAALYFNAQAGSDTAVPAGISRKRPYRVQLLDGNLQPCTDGHPAFLSMVDEDGQKIRFDAASGKVAAMVSASGRVITAEEHEATSFRTYDAEGNLTSCYTEAQGLMSTRTARDGSFIMEWFAPEAVTRMGDAYVGQGEPFKSVVYRVSQANGIQTVAITRQQRGLPPSTTIRTQQGNRITITKGEGDDAIIRTIETNSLFGGMSERIDSVRGINDASPVSCTREVKQFTEGGWLTISRTEAFNTPLARTTTYEYNEQFRVSRILRPDGGYTRYEYDSMGRAILKAEPWAGGREKITRTTYANQRFFDNRPARVVESYIQRNGAEVTMKTTVYTYEDSSLLNRVTETTSARNCATQTSIRETYGEAAAYPYAAGKTRFTQDISGVQAFYDYEAATEHNSRHKETITIKADGELVAAQSRKTERFIASNDTVVFEQESIWDGTAWLPLSSAAHEYDEQQRLTKTTRGNGRIRTKAWMCCGVLSETDEDGITTSYGYNSAHQLVETIRSEVRDGDTCITPETITTYVRDAAGRALHTRRDIGALTTTEDTVYDKLGRVVAQTDALGRLTRKEYSEDGLTTTVTTPAGATFITTRNTDGSIAHESGSGQRELWHLYDIQNYRLRETVKLGDNKTTLSQTLINGLGQENTRTMTSTTGYFYTRSEYNAKGQLIKQYQDTGSRTTPTAPILYEYDAFGNVIKQTLALGNAPTVHNSPIVETAYTVESTPEGVYQVTTRTRYNAKDEPLSTIRKQLISQSCPHMESKTISVNERGLASIQWTEYVDAAKRITRSAVPTSDTTAETVAADGFTLRQSDHTGVTQRFSRTFRADGMVLKATDGRGNTTITQTDLLGRTVCVTDATGATTSTRYDAVHNQPSVITDAMGNTSCYRYDHRGRKAAEWGTAIQPAVFTYDDADRLTSLTTFRASEVDITTDPSARTDGDTTRWTYHDATGLEIRKTYADGSHVDKAYDAYNRLSVETLARGITKTHRYEHVRGLLLGTAYSDGTTPRAYQYNHLGQLVQVTDDAGTRTIGYNRYGEQETDSLTTAEGVTHLITEARDTYGRSTGYSYSKDGEAQQTVATGYSANGRITTAGFIHNGEEQRFTYSYLPGSDLLQQLAMPNGVTLTQAYEPRRNLLTEMSYRKDGSTLASRRYCYDSLGRPTTRDIRQEGNARQDRFGYNTRSELTDAQLGLDAYRYSYDNIGNRKAAQGEAEATYTANALNQYTRIESANGSTHFSPAYDADGNQTLVKTSTGVWNVEYNAENRPVTFTRTEGNVTTRVTCTYDHQGRRATKKVESNGATTLHERYLYRGYLQIAACDLTSEGTPNLWRILWDPTQPIATRPLSIQKGSTWYTYGWDLTKNICEVFKADGSLATTYTYAPYGEVTANGSTAQPLQWSSEFYDDELGVVYYNFRYYTPNDGRWSVRDVGENISPALYSYLNNQFSEIDYLGNYPADFEACVLIVKLTWYLEHRGWPSKDEVDSWFDSAKKSIEHTFNNSLYKCYSSEKKCCKCTNGINVKVEVARTYDKKEADFIIKLQYTDSFMRSGVNRRKKIAKFDSLDIEPINRDKDIDNTTYYFTQIPVVHEFGHMLGLSHPGGRSNAPAAYLADPFSLMGLDMFLTEDNFNTAFCSKIEPSGETCKSWETGLNTDNALA